MSGKVVTGKTYPLLEDKLLEELRRARAGNIYGRIDILVGSNLLGRYLRTRLASALGGLLNIHFLTFPDMVSLMLERTGMAETFPLPPFAEKVIIDGMIASGDIPACFGNVAGTNGFPDALKDSFTDLSEAGCSIPVAGSLLDTLEVKGMHDRVGGLLSMFISYRERVESLGGDIHSHFRAATVPEASGFSGIPLIAYGFYDLNEEQWQLLSSIAENRGLILFVPWSDETPFRFARRLIDRCTAKGYEMVHVPDRATDKGMVGRGTLMVSMKDGEEELREIARMVIESVRNDGSRFGDMAIAIPSGVDVALLREIFDEAWIPFYLAGRLNTGISPAASGAIRLTELLGGIPGRGELVEFLVSAPLVIPADCGCGADPFSVWIRKSAEAGMTGEYGWLKENERLAGRLAGAVSRGTEMEKTVFSVTLVGDILGKILSAGSEFSGNADWEEFGERFSSVVAELFGDSDETLSVCRISEGLSSLDTVTGKTSRELFFKILRMALSELSTASGKLGGEGVNILPLGQARGLCFKEIFIPSLTENSMPGKISQDPFLKDDERAMLERVAGGTLSFSKRSGRIDEQALIFRLVCDSAADRLICSRPRAGTGSGREMIESSFHRFIDGWSPDGNHGPSLKEIRVPGRLGTIEDVDPLSSDEYDLLLMGSDRKKAFSVISSIFFSRGLRLSRKRWHSRELTPFDAVFSSPEAVSESRKILEEKKWSFSATSLERWARCPFAYFLGSVLGVESVAEPERILSIDPMQRGTLVHSILERLYSTLGKKGCLPLFATPRDRVRQITVEIIDSLLEEYPFEHPVGLNLFWEMEKHKIKQAVITYMEGELLESGGLVPDRFEESFGIGDEDAVTFETGKRTLSFHGRIDRIDLGEKGGFRVIDYKTGKLRGKDEDFGGGIYLQLPVYLLGASSKLGIPIEKGIAQYRQVSSIGSAVVSFSGSDWGKKKKEFARILDVIIGGIEKGMFCIYPFSTDCRFCSVGDACPSARTTLFELKAEHDERCFDFLAMKGYREEDDG